MAQNTQQPTAIQRNVFDMGGVYISVVLFAYLAGVFTLLAGTSETATGVGAAMATLGATGIVYIFRTIVKVAAMPR